MNYSSKALCAYPRVLFSVPYSLHIITYNFSCRNIHVRIFNLAVSYFPKSYLHLNCPHNLHLTRLKSHTYQFHPNTTSQLLLLYAIYWDKGTTILHPPTNVRNLETSQDSYLPFTCTLWSGIKSCQLQFFCICGNHPSSLTVFSAFSSILYLI